MDHHKYLGKKLPGDLTTKVAIDVTHRVQLAWMKFHEGRGSLKQVHDGNGFPRTKRLESETSNLGCRDHAHPVVWFDDRSIDEGPT